MSAKKRPIIDVSEMQLHNQFKRYDGTIDNIDDTYVLVGSSVLNALFNYLPRVPNKDKEQYIFDQMKQLYGRLSAVVSSSESIDVFNVVLSHEQKAMRELELLHTAGTMEKIPSSSLLEIILEKTNILNKRNKAAVIRDGGSRLYHNVIERGPYQGNRNIMLKDYSDIEAAFK